MASLPGTIIYRWVARDNLILAKQDRFETAHERLATGRPMTLSAIGELDAQAFALFLAVLAEALAEQRHPDRPIERLTSDGTMRLRLEPLATGTNARIRTPQGVFAGRDHVVTITAVD